MSDDGYSDTYSDDFAPYDDYYEDDDLVLPPLIPDKFKAN